MPTCDNCGGRMQVQDDDSLYCPYCGATSGPEWVVWTDQPPDPTWEEIQGEAED